MSSLFLQSSSSPGHGEIHVDLAPPATHSLSRLSFTYPLKLISPTPYANSSLEDSDAPAKCVVVFILSYGGGLVSGDRVDLDIRVAEGAKLSLLTQGTTKIFKQRPGDGTTKQKLNVTINDRGALLLLPDPVQPFADSCYEQFQKFTLVGKASSIAVLDWVSEGRTARGESWDFAAWSGKNEVWQSQDTSLPARLLLRDNQMLHRPTGRGVAIKEKMKDTRIFGTLIIYGLKFEKLASFFMSEYGHSQRIGAKRWDQNGQPKEKTALETWRAERQQEEKEKRVLWSAATVRGCVVVKFAGLDVQSARDWLRGMLVQEGTIERDFGEACLFCLR